MVMRRLKMDGGAARWGLTGVSLKNKMVIARTGKETLFFGISCGELYRGANAGRNAFMWVKGG